jgi:hypothetical protein
MPFCLNFTIMVITAPQGISARVIKHSATGNSALLAIASEEDAFGIQGPDTVGWVKFNPSKLPALQTTLALPYTTCTITQSVAESVDADGVVSKSTFDWLSFSK